MYTALLAEMWDDGDHMGAGWWWVMGIGWLLFLAFIGLLAYLLVRHHTDAGDSGRQRQAPSKSSRNASRGARLTRTSIAVVETHSGVERHADSPVASGRARITPHDASGSGVVHARP